MPEGTCSIEGCDSVLYVKGMCRPHYRRADKYGDPLYVAPVKRCAVEGCDRKYHANDYCEMHLARFNRNGDPGPADRVRAERKAPCLVEDCEEPSSAKMLCPKHYQRFLRFGDPLHVPKGAHPAGPVRHCKWCGKEFDKRVGGRLLCCSDKCRRIVELLVSRLSTYGMTVDRYRKIWDAQGGVCRLCGNEQQGRLETLAVDHDHACCPGKRSCGKCVRGLLCDRCNNGLGCFGDDVALIRSAADYVEAFRVSA